MDTTTPKTRSQKRHRRQRDEAGTGPSTHLALCFLVTEHPTNCQYWQHWRDQHPESVITIYHCDKVPATEALSCGPTCVLGTDRVESHATTWGGPGVVEAELALYRRALAMGATHAVVLSETCVPLFFLADFLAWLRRHPRKSVLTTGPDLTPPCQLQKLLTAEVMRVLVDPEDGMTQEDIHAFDEDGAICRAQMRRREPGVFGTWNPDERCILDFLLRRKGHDWLSDRTHQQPLTFACFRDPFDHHPMTLSLGSIPIQCLRDHRAWFVRKVRRRVPLRWFPLERY